MASLLTVAGPTALGAEPFEAMLVAFQSAMKLKTPESLRALVAAARRTNWRELPEAIGPLARDACPDCLEAIAVPGVTTDIAMVVIQALISRMEVMADGPYRVEHDESKNLATYAELLQACRALPDDLRAAATDAAVVGFEHLAGIEVFKALVARQHGFFPGRTHIGPDQAVQLLHGIPGLAYALARQATAARFAGLLHAAALHVEQPAVVAAADAALLDLAVEQRGATVRAVRIDQARAAALVAEQDQILAQHTHLARCIRGIARQADRVPVAPQQLAHGRAGAGRRRLLSAPGGRGRGPHHHRGRLDPASERVQ